MKNAGKLAAVILLAAAVAATFALREAKRAGGPPATPPAVAASALADPSALSPAAPPASPAGRPRIVELGSVRCQACQQMMKVLDALRASQGERLQVDFVDVFEDPAAGEHYGLTMIPTQVLYDAQGREFFRHVGFLSHDDILAKFRELGVKL